MTNLVSPPSKLFEPERGESQERSLNPKARQPLADRLAGPPDETVLIATTLLIALIGGSIQIWLYADADQLDSGYHYLFARWSWHHPEYLLSVWARPLFTLIYSLPAQLGYTAARFFTLLISLLAAHQTWRLARQLGISPASVVVPLLLAQPVFWELGTGVYTESLFALFLVLALRLQAGGRSLHSLLTASMLILIRPEGLFTGIFWGAWHLASAFRSARRENRWRGTIVAAFQSLLLATGMVIWVAAAWLYTGDPLWIIHNWPPDWNPSSQANGTGPLWWYLLLLPVITGPFVLPAFIAGIREHRRRDHLLSIPGLFTTIFVVHSILYYRGWFGSAGYARYFVCVSPATALIAGAGWTALRNRIGGNTVIVLIAVSLLFSFLRLDVMPHGRDSHAIKDLHRQFVQSPETRSLPITRLICSQPGMRIVFDRDHWEMPGLTADRGQNLELVRRLSPGTLVFWDDQTGPAWYRLTADDFVQSGFEPLLSRDYLLSGRLLPIQTVGLLGARRQTLHILYRR